jgi:hypothetical protein
MDWIAVAGEASGEAIGRVEEPSIAGFGREQDELAGYLTALSRPELVVHFFRDIVGVAEVSKEALSQRTADYQGWVEAHARNHSIPIE